MFRPGFVVYLLGNWLVWRWLALAVGTGLLSPAGSDWSRESRLGVRPTALRTQGRKPCLDLRLGVERTPEPRARKRRMGYPRYC